MCVLRMCVPLVVFCASFFGVVTAQYSWSNGIMWVKTSGTAGQGIACQGSVLAGYCIVPADKAELMCLAHPECAYILTPTSTWAAQNWVAHTGLSNPVQLLKAGGSADPQNPDWTVSTPRTLGNALGKWFVRSGMIGSGFVCAETQIPGYCIVNAQDAPRICQNNPTCKYIDYTSNSGWNAHAPGLVSLSTDPLTANSEWTSVEVPRYYPGAMCVPRDIVPLTGGYCTTDGSISGTIRIWNEFQPSTQMKGYCWCKNKMPVIDPNSYQTYKQYTMVCNPVNAIWQYPDGSTPERTWPTECQASGSGGGGAGGKPVNLDIQVDDGLQTPNPVTTSTNTTLIIAIVVPVVVTLFLLTIIGIVVCRRRSHKNDIAALAHQTSTTPNNIELAAAGSGSTATLTSV